MFVPVKQSLRWNVEFHRGFKQYWGQAVDVKHMTGTSIIHSLGNAKPRTITIHGRGNPGLLLTLMPLQEATLPRMESCNSRLEKCRIYGALKLYDWGRSTERFQKDFGEIADISGIKDSKLRSFGTVDRSQAQSGELAEKTLRGFC